MQARGGRQGGLAAVFRGAKRGWCRPAALLLPPHRSELLPAHTPTPTAAAEVHRPGGGGGPQLGDPRGAEGLQGGGGVRVTAPPLPAELWLWPPEVLPPKVFALHRPPIHVCMPVYPPLSVDSCTLVPALLWCSQTPPRCTTTCQAKGRTAAAPGSLLVGARGAGAARQARGGRAQPRGAAGRACQQRARRRQQVGSGGPHHRAQGRARRLRAGPGVWVACLVVLNISRQQGSTT